MVQRTFLGIAVAAGLVAATVGFTSNAESIELTGCQAEVWTGAEELVDNILSVLKAGTGNTVTQAERETLIKKVAGNTGRIFACVSDQWLDGEATGP